MTRKMSIFLIVFPTLFAGTDIAHADTGTSSYGYDLDGRLRTAHYSNGNCTLYDLDANGNRLSAAAIAPVSLPPLWGQATWGNASWVPGNSNAIWGSGTFGCAVWTAP